MHRLLVTLVIALGLLGLPGGSAHAAEPPVVTWPTTTAFNPDTTTYEVTVDDPDGTGTLMASWRGGEQEIAHAGTTAITFAEPGVGVVQIFRCGGSVGAICRALSASPQLSVYDRIIVTDRWLMTDRLTAGAGVAPLRLWIEPGLSAASYSVTWELTTLADHSDVVSSGTTSTRVHPQHHYLQVPVTIPAGLEQTAHRLVARISATTADYGAIEGVKAFPVDVDQVAPVLSVTGDTGTIFPARDGYRDDTYLSVDGDGDSGGTAFFEVRDPTGRVLDRAVEDVSASGRMTWYWDGRVRSRVLPAGAYTLALGITDFWGNTSTVLRPTRVSDHVRQMVSFRRTVSARASEVDRYVGRCSTLKGRGKGSLLLASRSRCTGKNSDDDAVVTQHGMYLPRAIGGRFTSYRVSLAGGPATGAADSYLVLGYLQGSDFSHRVVFRKGSRHVGRAVRRPDSLVQDRGSDRPYVLWTTGLSEGSRYVVRSFTVEISYLALAPPRAGRRERPQPVPQQTSVSPRAAASYSS